MKWTGLALVIASLAVRFWWRPTFGIGLPAGPGMRRAYGANVVAFWMLLAAGALVLLLAFLRSEHR